MEELEIEDTDTSENNGVDSDDDTEETDSDDTDTDEDTDIDELEFSEDDDDDIEAIKEKNKKLFARAKKAEAKAKGVKGKVQTDKTTVAPNKTKVAPKKPSQNDTLETRLDEMDRDNLNVESDELWDEIKTYAKAKGLTNRQAYKSDYIQFLVDKAKKKETENAASISKSGKKATKIIRDFANAKPSDFDTSTPEGEEAFNKYKAWLKEND